MSVLLHTFGSWALLPAPPVAADMHSMVIPFIVLVAILIIVGAIFGHRQKLKRRERMAGLAEHWGGSFDHRNNSRFDERYPMFGCFRKGEDRYAYNVIRGRGAEDASLLAFDYHYETYSTDSKGNRTTHHHHFSALILELSYPLKPLRIRKEGFFDKIGDMFGGGDIDFESAEFSRKFHVKAEDRKWAYDVISTDTMAFLLRSPVFTLEMHGNRLLVHRNRTFKVADFTHARGVGEGLLARIPADIKQDLMRGDPV